MTGKSRSEWLWTAEQDLWTLLCLRTEKSVNQQYKTKRNKKVCAELKQTPTLLMQKWTLTVVGAGGGGGAYDGRSGKETASLSLLSTSGTSHCLFSSPATSVASICWTMSVLFQFMPKNAGQITKARFLDVNITLLCVQQYHHIQVHHFLYCNHIIITQIWWKYE